MDNFQKIEKREARLLRREGYLRRIRHVAFGLCVMGLIVEVVVPSLGVLPASENGYPYPDWAVIAFLFVLGYHAHLRIRHIESIKFHRERLKAPGA